MAKGMRLPAALAALALSLLAACSVEEEGNDPGPKPPADHQELVGSKMFEILQQRSPRGTPTALRFDPPALDHVARWHFDVELPGQSYEFGSVNGWKVEFWYTPEYDGYPPQPEHHQMAFFGGGQLRAIFSEGLGNAPFDLDKWHRDWVDASWHPLPDKRMQRASSR
jgi:hypothetical protein